MTTITVQLDDSKIVLLREKAQKYGLRLDQFVAASIDDLIIFHLPKFLNSTNDGKNGVKMVSLC